jgi:hypothetical protein
MIRKLFFLLGITFFCGVANAYQIIEGKVTLLEATFLPSLVTFQMAAGTTTCPAGNFLRWSNADPANNKAVYSTLMAAFLSGKNIRLYINDGDATCTGVFVHIFN